MAEGATEEAVSADQNKRPSGVDIANGLCEHVLTAKFFENHWEKAPLHYRASEQGRQGNRLAEGFSVDDMATILRKCGPSLKMFKQGQPCNSDNFILGYLDGASLIVNQVDRYNKTLFDLCRTMAERHFLHVFGVAYLTPSSSQAVRLHNDDQDVFLLQVWGRKNWRIRQAPKLLPYTEEMVGKDTPVPEEMLRDVVMEFTMEPHDVLYIPRGYLHEAATGEEPSLHITVTIPTSDYCWGVQLTKHLLQRFLQQEVPRDLYSFDEGALEEKLQGVLKDWTSSLRVDDVLDAFDERMERTNAGQLQQFEKAQAAELRPWVTEDSRVRLMYGVSCWCEPDGEVAIFSRASDGQKLEMPIASSAAALIRSLTSKPQRVTDLPCRDALERIFVLQVLRGEEVVQLFLEQGSKPAPRLEGVKE